MDLRFVNSSQPLDCFQFEDQLTVDQQVQSLAADMNIFVWDLDIFLAFKRNALKPQFMAHRQLINFLHEAWAQLPMDLNCNSDHAINQVFLLWRQWAFNSQSGHLLTSSSRFWFLRGCYLYFPSRSSFLRGCYLYLPSRPSFIRSRYLTGYFSTNRLAMTSRCNSFVPPPITSSGASR